MTAPASTGLTGRDFALVTVMNIMWGLNLIAVKVGVDLVSPLTAAWLRQTMVLFICLPFLRIIPGKMRELLALGLLSGALFYIVINLSLAAADNISSLAIAGQLSVPFSLILAVIVFKERIRLYRIGGIALSFSGVILIVFDPAAVNERLGLALTALGSLIWAICSLIQRRLAGVPVMTIYAWVGAIGSLILLPVAFVVEPATMMALPTLPWAAFGWILFSALGSTVIGQGAMSLLLARHPLTTVVPMTLLTPVISVIAASLYFKTKLTPIMIIGGIIVMIGIAIVTIRTAQANEAKSKP
ncbi:MAG: DMT family transporter [Sphingomonadaceae bacterium]